MTFRNFRLVALLAVAVALAIAVRPFFLQDKNPCAAIPSEAAIVLDFNPIDTAGTAGLPHIRDYGLRFFVEKSDIQAVRQQASQAQKMLQHDGPLRRAFQSNRMLAALTWRSEDRGSALFVLDLQGTDAHLEQAVAALRNAGSSPLASHSFLRDVQVSEQQFRGSTLWVFAEPDRDRFVFAQQNGLLIFSTSLALVEDALAQLEVVGNWWSTCAFLRKPDPATPFRALMRGSVLAQRLGERLLPQHQSLPLPLLRHLDWLGLSWDGHALRAEAGQKGLPNHRTAWDRTQLSEIYGVLPSNTAFALRVGFPTSWPVLKKMDRPLSPDFEEFIGPWWGREAAFVVTEPLSNNLTDHEFWVLEARDTARASALLSTYGQQRGLLKNYDYQTFVIRQLLDGGLLRPLADEGSAFQNPACAVVGGYVVFATSPAALERWIDQYVVGETLSANADFLQMTQSLPAESGGALLFNSASLPVLARNLYRPDWMLKNVQSLDAFAPMGWVGLGVQFSGSSRSLELNIARGPTATAISQTSGLLWKTPLTAAVALAPQVVSRPPAEDGTDILVQDVQHQLYCLHQDGQLHWRRQLPGPILSEVQGLDFFKNQTRCYFFNTPDALWLLDENGRDVEGFPLKLRSPATNGAVAVSFGNNGECGFFVALENGNVQGFNPFGQPIDGWNPQPIGEQVSQPLLHFQHAGKDYLAVLTHSGRLSVFGKNGQLRFAPVQFEGQFEGAMQVNLETPTPCIVCINSRGRAFACDMAGRAVALSLEAGDGSAARSGFLPLGAGGALEYAVLTGSTLTYGHYDSGQYRQIFSQKNDRSADAVFVPQSGCVGVLRRQQRSVMLYRSGTVRSFEGSTAFRLLAAPGGSGSVLVVGNGASVCGYWVE